ncbi:MAG: VacJ family lipoprotein [Lautropia sp.]
MLRSDAPRARALAVLASAAVLAGCATTGPASPNDPYEGFNRGVFEFNDALDRYALKPLARGYQAVVPETVRFIVGNMFANLGDVYTALNQLLQGKPVLALSDLTRFVVNSTWGFAGAADVASAIGLARHDEDFGQTLGRWGVPSGPYLVLPFFGPSTFRDAPARYVDSYGNPVGYIPDIPARNSAYGLSVVDTRAGLLRSERLLDGAALDKYSLIRDGWLQRRRNAVHDGDPPDELPNYEEDEEPKSK